MLKWSDRLGIKTRHIKINIPDSPQGAYLESKGDILLCAVFINSVAIVESTNHKFIKSLRNTHDGNYFLLVMVV